jgi:hypothetical protein
MTHKTVLGIFLILFIQIATAQEFEGTWVGSVQGLPLVFEIASTDSIYTAQMQSPKQSKAFITADEVTVEKDVINLKIEQFQIKYQGQLNGGAILGTFTQGGMSFPLDLEKKAYDESTLRRKQEPVAPFSYQVEEVEFTNESAGGIKLSGTLTLPPGLKSPPVAILISGSGPQDRNEEIMNHKPFLVLADHLTKKGIAVLRFDDRGVGKSQGDHNSATSADFATDVAAAVEFLLKRGDIDSNKIGLIGHSEGGLIAPMVIAQHPDKIAFFVSLAGPGLRGDQVLLPQIKKAAQLAGSPEEDIEWGVKLMKDLFKQISDSSSLTQEQLSQELAKSLAAYVATGTSAQTANYPKEAQAAVVQQFSQPWMRYFLTYDPTSDLQKIKIPTLLLNGSLDFQVIPELNLPAMEKKIQSNGNNDVTAMQLDQLNHLFQTAITGSGAEYAVIEETFAPVALETISTWINKRF